MEINQTQFYLKQKYISLYFSTRNIKTLQLILYNLFEKDRLEYWFDNIFLNSFLLIYLLIIVFYSEIVLKYLNKE